MEVQSNHPAGGINPASTVRTEARRTKEPTEQVNFAQSAAVEQALQKTPEIRTEAVDRAKALVGSINYPPPETIRRLSNLLAMHLPVE
ncbi:MAG: hypothetical protein JNK85_15230 [Verrucomicrobiales bacterium]|nr:hypothetical protein [Verrucomicrobiales bacterium]